MKHTKILFDLFIWWAVIGFSIWLGGTIFSMSVMVPMWSEDLPQSARFFFGETSFTNYIYNFYGPPWMVIRNAPLIIALALCWKSVKHRKYLLISFIILVLSIIFTKLYVYPINEELMFKAGENVSDYDLTILAKKWIWADRLRFLVMAAGYIFLLLAFRLPMKNKVI